MVIKEKIKCFHLIKYSHQIVRRNKSIKQQDLISLIKSYKDIMEPYSHMDKQAQEKHIP